MKITRDERNVIYRHECGQEVEGSRKQFILFSMSIAISLFVVSMLTFIIKMRVVDSFVVFIFFTAVLYLLVFVLNHAYMNLYLKYNELKKVVQKVILANKY